VPCPSGTISTRRVLGWSAVYLRPKENVAHLFEIFCGKSLLCIIWLVERIVVRGAEVDDGVDAVVDGANVDGANVDGVDDGANVVVEGAVVAGQTPVTVTPYDWTFLIMPAILAGSTDGDKEVAATK
jgi:hypothetical protein